MTNSVHPLQEITVHLLNALYQDKQLPVTPAMLAILNGQYPAIESIIETLNRYSEIDLVSKFISKNSELIENTKNEIEDNRIQVPENEDGESEQTEASLFTPSFETIDAYEVLKEIPLAEIEKSLSDELTALCKEDLALSIESIHGSVSDSKAELNVIVKSKRGFR